MSKHIILGDVHLGRSVSIGKPGVAGGLNSRIKDQIDLLDWVLNTSISNDCYHIIITGDVFEDHKPHYSLIKIFIDWLIKCSINGVAVDIVAGNHDMQRTGSNYNSALDIINTIDLKGITVYKEIQSIDYDNVSFTYLPFRDRRGLICETHDQAINLLKERLLYQNEYCNKNNIKICVGHLTLLGALPVGDEIDDITNELMCPPDMFSGYDYVFMGHIHKPQVRNKIPYQAHVGSMDISDFGEVDHIKKIILFNSENKNPLQEIDIPTRKFVKIKIDVPEDKDSNQFVLEKLEEINNKNPIKDSILRLEIKLASKTAENVDRQKVEELLNTYQVHHICNFSETRNVIVVNINKEENIDNAMDVSKAIKLWSEAKVIEQDKEEFIKEALDVYYQLQEATK